MPSYMFDIGEKSRKSSRFISMVRRKLQQALLEEKKTRKLTQQAIAQKLGVNRSVVNRQLTGEENLTLRSVAEIAWALGWDAKFDLVKPETRPGSNGSTPALEDSTNTQNRVVMTPMVSGTGRYETGKVDQTSTTVSPTTPSSQRYK